MSLKLEKPVTPLQPPTEPLRTAAWIAAVVFAGERNARWVREHCPRVALAPRTIRYLESDVRQWVDGLRKSA